MEGYTENGRRNRRRRPDWLCGHAPQEKAAPRIERIPAQGNRRGGAGAFRRQYHAGATDFRIRHEQHDVAYGHGAMRSGVGVAFVHYYNGKLGYKHSWTKWMFYAFYPVILLICAAVA